MIFPSNATGVQMPVINTVQPQQQSSGFNPLSLLGGIGAGIGAIGDIAQTGLNIYNSVKQNKLAQETFEYNKQLNELQMQREDTAMQRQMKDLQQAGLNPLLAVGGNGSSSSAGSQLSAPQIHSPVIANNTAQRLNMAYSGLQQAMSLKSQQATLRGQEIDNAIKEYQLNNDMQNKSLSIVLANELKRSQQGKVEAEKNYLENEKSQLTKAQKQYLDEQIFRYTHDNELLKYTAMPSARVLDPEQSLWGKWGNDIIKAVSDIAGDTRKFGYSQGGLVSQIIEGTKKAVQGDTPDNKLLNNAVSGLVQSLSHPFQTAKKWANYYKSKKGGKK